MAAGMAARLPNDLQRSNNLVLISASPLSSWLMTLRRQTPHIHVHNNRLFRSGALSFRPMSADPLLLHLMPGPCQGLAILEEQNRQRKRETGNPGIPAGEEHEQGRDAHEETHPPRERAVPVALERHGEQDHRDR